MDLEQKIKSTIRDVVDYPKPGIIFKDITPLFSDPLLIREIIDSFKRQLVSVEFDAIAAVEARGFIFGAILAYEMNRPFIPIRKVGKLPYTTVQQEYALEYGSATIEMHSDAVRPGWKVLVHDDVLATGGTAAATGAMLQSVNADVAGFSFLINLSFLPGEANLNRQFGNAVHSLVTY